MEKKKKSQVRGGGEVAETLSDGEKKVWKENRKNWGWGEGKYNPPCSV